MGKASLNRLVHQIQTKFEQLQPSLESADYKAWRDQFLWRRLSSCLWVAFAVLFCSIALDIYRVFYIQDWEPFPKQFKHLLVIENAVIVLLLFICWILHRTKFGHRYPGVLFLCISFSISLVLQIFATFSGFARPDVGNWILLFMVQATLIPVRPLLHLVSHLGPLVYYVGVNSLLGLTTSKGYPLFTVEFFLVMFWVCFTCDLAVYLYERWQRAEFESRRELQVFLHAISHDLRTPLMGTSIVLQNLLKKSESQLTINRSVLERLLEGNSRQISLINSLQEAYSLEVRGVELHCQPLQLSTVVNSVLCDLEPLATQNRVLVKNQVNNNLPLVNADAIQLRRVFSNLIGNALKHNPHEITLTLDAIAQEKKILCRVQDNGVGMSKKQCVRVFELYTRGEKARFMPGLGLGLYVCKQIITAHGGKIGVTSHIGAGTTFWFTLPLE
ncbi:MULTISPECIES: sensor histidine kinase [Fischerella]|uniref:sensor histidine kinase n=1 Tax=Fischerella TaxID=1190 RepID=UPI0002D9B849|nr:MULTISPECIES: HAMP domain-containing sensor histidine kinase [Fischerella]MBD2431747.1 HAMP domain-containing histidine kinase [Fischerella sp. FACHB-380]